MKILKIISNLFKSEKKETEEIEVQKNTIEKSCVQKSTDKNNKYICDFYIAGLSHENRISKIKNINDNTKITLVPEPDNFYDDTAVAVYAENIGKIGYVPAFLTLKVNDFIADGLYDLEYSIDFRPGKERVFIEITRDTKPLTYRERRTLDSYNERVKKQNNTDFTNEELYLISSIKQMLTDHDKSLEKVTFTKTAKYFDVIKFTQIIRIRLGVKLKYVLINKNDDISLPISEGDSSERYCARVLFDSVEDIYKFTDYIITKYDESDVEEDNYLNNGFQYKSLEDDD